ncbi:chromosome segregation ATPase [Bacillus ectoiniformans]|uniref:hypothetical protein n=1 Tax=Bacillus ectoiniformans TaxID=1494429 RepID=UPI001957A213|nr:hypothetical protein [Bacillus ectoiniformans]MBM7650393.1 chromosome segregation ATPase [Bacillus ectoiniformans]
MPAISKIRLTNVVYEEGNKRYNDELFRFDGHNGAILLENGGGKTVLIQTALQAIIPHTDLANRKIKSTLQLEQAPAHIAIEWVTNDQPRRYVVTAVSLFLTKNGIDSLRYVYEYNANDSHGIERIPFVCDGNSGKRPAEKGELQDYYSSMRERWGQTFQTIKDYRAHLEEQYHIVGDEWDSIVKINSSEGGVEAFFEECKQTNQLLDRLLIPTVENSIAGHDRHLFANMFEKQHESFKQYKKLKETIEENKKIQTQLEAYVGVFEKFHEQKQAYEKSKQIAKGMWNEIHIQKNKMRSEHDILVNKFHEWQQKQDNYKVKLASFDIVVEYDKFVEFKNLYDQAYAQFLETQEKLATDEYDYYSLRFAELRGEEKEHTDQLVIIEKELATYDNSENLQELDDRLIEAKQALLGYLLGEVEQVIKQIESVSYELNPLDEQLRQIREQLQQWKKAERERRDELATVKSRLQIREADMKKFEKQLLANPSQQTVEEEMKKWEVRYNELDREIVNMVQEDKQLQLSIKESEASIQGLDRSKVEKDKMLGKVIDRLIIIEQEEKEILSKLASVRPQWLRIHSVYDNESSISSRLFETLEHMQAEREHLLLKERLAYRFVDDYENQDIFFADAFLEAQLNSWKNQFEFVRTGIEFLQSLQEQDYEMSKIYPLWALTLVTTNKSKPALLDKLSKNAARLQFPIQVVTTEEAATIHQTEALLTWVAPEHWHIGANQDAFLYWKENIAKTALHTKLTRQDKEYEVKAWEQAQTAFGQFIKNYPYDKVVQLQEERSELEKAITQLTIAVKSEEEKLTDMRERINKHRKAIKQSEDEKQGLESMLEKANTYMIHGREVNRYRKNLHQIDLELTRLNQDISRLEQQRTRLIEEQEVLKEQKASLQATYKILRNSEEYKAIRGLTPIFTEESKLAILDKMKHLEYEMRSIRVTYGEWQEKLTNTKTNINRIQEELDRLKMEHHKLDVDRLFPVDGKQRLMQLWKRIEKARQVGKETAKDVDAKRTAKDQQESKWKTKLEQFEDNYAESTVTFTAPLVDVREELAREEKELENNKVFLEQEKKRIDKEITSIIEDGERSLDRYIEKHHFNAPNIMASALNEDDKLQFVYNRKKYVDSIIHNLEAQSKLVDQETDKVQRAKQGFRQFCQTITDIKMQRMAETGIDLKETFGELIDFKNNMLSSVERASNYANEHIRQKDVELQAFINQIHAHLKTIVEELRHIPKKTKVKVDNDWKQIFSFTVPDWTEEDGKNRIRNHIEWILQQLETDRYTSDDGKARKDIEMWLQSKQLLQIVMQHEGMKVSCRKVTNDNKVTNRSYTWEQSNAWSGGEKWSKNMTLFLGILNYVAEKQQHIQANMKRHRAVILDNPFGKASSDHVLSPVFFVAEQLGFQIITLTAHAEGKFLQDYFPVIYSCRLRESADASKKIMTKEKRLHHAYFRDHEPKSIERLGETEQMRLPF